MYSTLTRNTRVVTWILTSRSAKILQDLCKLQAFVIWAASIVAKKWGEWEVIYFSSNEACSFYELSVGNDMKAKLFAAWNLHYALSSFFRTQNFLSFAPIKPGAKIFVPAALLIESVPQSKILEVATHT